MTASTATAGGPTRVAARGSISGSRRKALIWSYIFLVMFAIFFLMPPIYMFITSLKSSAEISAVTNPWFVYHPTLSNYIELLTSKTYLTFFRNSALVSLIVVTLTMCVSI
ncbi:MAG: carbohydrate ABC transporter permease, partial [Alphaproteobacteria bacterium]|nr:carbohydrate ABC transporter permease [Alphaproteobacteria bacterium]